MGQFVTSPKQARGGSDTDSKGDATYVDVNETESSGIYYGSGEVPAGMWFPLCHRVGHRDHDHGGRRRR